MQKSFTFTGVSSGGSQCIEESTFVVTATEGSKAILPFRGNTSNILLVTWGNSSQPSECCHYILQRGPADPNVRYDRFAMDNNYSLVLTEAKAADADTYWYQVNQ